VGSASQDPLPGRRRAEEHGETPSARYPPSAVGFSAPIVLLARQGAHRRAEPTADAANWPPARTAGTVEFSTRGYVRHRPAPSRSCHLQKELYSKKLPRNIGFDAPKPRQSWTSSVVLRAVSGGRTILRREGGRESCLDFSNPGPADPRSFLRSHSGPFSARILNSFSAKFRHGTACRSAL